MLKQNTKLYHFVSNNSMKMKCTNPLPTWEEVLEDNSRAIIHHLLTLETLVPKLRRRVDSLDVEGLTRL